MMAVRTMGRTPNEVKEDKKRVSTYLDMLMALRADTGLSEVTIRKVYLALVKYVLDELKMNGVVRLRYIGNFYVRFFGGYAKDMPNPRTGEMIPRFVKPTMRVKFVSSEKFKNALDEPLSEEQKNRKGKLSALIEPDSELKEQKEVLVKNLLKKESYKLTHPEEFPKKNKLDTLLDDELINLEDDMNLSTKESADE
jgi:nucleoid DNA-binding protein